MAITCSACGKKQTSFLEDFPLSNNLTDFRICIACKEHKDSLIRYSKTDDINSYSISKDYFNEIITKNECDETVKEYLDKLLLDCDSYRTIEEQKQLQRLKEEEEKLRQAGIFKGSVEACMVTTSSDFNGFHILEYKGIVTGETIIGTGFLSEFSAGPSDFFGSQSDKFSNKMSTAHEAALLKMKQKAVMAGANAVISVHLDYITFQNNMIGAVANGTAVLIRRNR